MGTLIFYVFRRFFDHYLITLLPLLLMHQYVLIESHRKASVALWVHPFDQSKNKVMVIKCTVGTLIFYVFRRFFDHYLIFRLIKGVYPQSNGSLAMAFYEYILMHQKCLSICGYTSFLRQSAFIEMVIE